MAVISQRIRSLAFLVGAALTVCFYRINRDARRLSPRLLCCSLCCLFAAAPARAEDSPAPEQVALQLKWTHAFQFAGYYAALEKGYYREAGLEVKIVEATPGVDPVSNVIAGKAQYGVGTSSLLLQRSAGKPVVALAVIFQHSPYVLIARQQSGTQGIHDLVGKRIMLEPQSDEILAYLKAEGISPERFTRVEHSYDPQDLIAGRVDAIAGYVTNQPYYLDLAGIPYQTYTPRSAGIDFYGDNLFTTEQELRDHPARVKAFRAASLRGWQYAMAHPQEMADLILAKYSQRHTRDYYLFEARQMIPLLRPELIEIGYMYPGRWRHMAEVYADLGMLKPDFSLKGFLYDPKPPPPDLRWLYGSLAAALALALVVGLIAARFSRLSTRLRSIIADQKQAEEALQAARKTAETANAAKDQFIAMLSHELRTPLSPVLMTVSALLEMRPDLPADVRADLAGMQRHIQRETRLIDDLLDLTRLTRGKVQLHLEAVDVHACLRSALEVCRADMHTKHVEVSFLLEADKRVVRADADRLHQVFGNLMRNAVKFMPQQGKLTIRSRNTDGLLQIEITDTGIGIAAEMFPRLFQPFEQADQAKSRTYRGLGLGLAIARNLVELHGGTIHASSPGLSLGATFTVELPTIEATPAPPTPPFAPMLADASARRILLVEDDAGTLEAITRVLRAWGYEVVTADCMQAALEAVRREKFDVLVSDIGLPDGGGAEVMLAAKERYGLRGIALSGYGTDDDQQRSLEAGFETHLTKPVDFRRLATAIQRVQSPVPGTADSPQ